MYLVVIEEYFSPLCKVSYLERTFLRNPISLNHKVLVFYLLKSLSYQCSWFISGLVLPSFWLIAWELPATVRTQYVTLFTFRTTTGWITRFSVASIMFPDLSQIDVWFFLWHIWHVFLLLCFDSRCPVLLQLKRNFFLLRVFLNSYICLTLSHSQIHNSYDLLNYNKHRLWFLSLFGWNVVAVLSLGMLFDLDLLGNDLSISKVLLLMLQSPSHVIYHVITGMYQGGGQYEEFFVSSFLFGKVTTLQPLNIWTFNIAETLN